MNAIKQKKYRITLKKFQFRIDFKRKMALKLFEFLEQVMIGTFFDKIWENWIKDKIFYFSGKFDN